MDTIHPLITQLYTKASEVVNQEVEEELDLPDPDEETVKAVLSGEPIKSADTNKSHDGLGVGDNSKNS